MPLAPGRCHKRVFVALCGPDLPGSTLTSALSEPSQVRDGSAATSGWSPRHPTCVGRSPAEFVIKPCPSLIGWRQSSHSSVDAWPANGPAFSRFGGAHPSVLPNMTRQVTRFWAASPMTAVADAIIPLRTVAAFIVEARASPKPTKIKTALAQSTATCSRDGRCELLDWHRTHESAGVEKAKYLVPHIRSDSRG